MDVESANKKNAPSAKRIKKFYEIFKSIPKNESLRYSSTCLLNDSSNYHQGRVYISTEHISFFSKSFFSRAFIIIKLKDVIAIEVTTKILLQHCLNIILYGKTYSFRAMSFKDEAYPIALEAWQRLLDVPPDVKSIFQVNTSRPTIKLDEKQMEESEKVFNISIQNIFKAIANLEKANVFYKTLTEDKIVIKTYLNRRTIRFANEFIDEVYKIENNSILIDYHSRGTLCKIYITPKSRNKIQVRIVEKYNYTTQHYFNYISTLIDGEKNNSLDKIVYFIIFIILLCKVSIALANLKE